MSMFQHLGSRTGRVNVQDPQLQSEPKASLAHMRPCLRKKKTKTNKKYVHGQKKHEASTLLKVLQASTECWEWEK